MRTNDAGHSRNDHSVNFTATSDGIMIPCAVCDETLQELSGVTITDPHALIAILHENQSMIAEVLAKKWKRQAFEEDNYAVVTPNDIWQTV